MHMKKLVAFMVLLSMLTGCAGQDHLNQGKKLLDEQKFPEAEAAYLKATEADAKNPEAWNGLGTARMQQGKVEQALTDYGKAIQLARDNKVAAIDLGRYCFDRGILLYAQGQYENASDDFNQAVNSGYKLGDSYAYLGVVVGQMGDDITALTHLSAAVKADPQNHFAWSNRGYYNSKVGDNKTAIYDLGKAIEIKPDDKVSYLNRGYTYIGMGDYVTALKDIDKALELDPDYLGAIAYKGIALTNSGQSAAALPFLDRAISLQPENPAFYYYRGAARISVGMIDSACVDLLHAEAGGHMDGVAMRQQYCK
jgi:tetratricopeptide (TPR) repeat protein